MYTTLEDLDRLLPKQRERIVYASDEERRAVAKKKSRDYYYANRERLLERQRFKYAVKRGDERYTIKHREEMYNVKHSNETQGYKVKSYTHRHKFLKKQTVIKEKMKKEQVYYK
jgi:hypothetical protein